MTKLGGVRDGGWARSHARGKKREVNEGERDRLFSAKFTEDNEHPWHLANECCGSSPSPGVGRLTPRGQ